MLQEVSDEDLIMNTTIGNDGTVLINLVTHNASSHATSQQPNDLNLLMPYLGEQSDATSQPHSSFSLPNGTVLTHPIDLFDLVQPDPSWLLSYETPQAVSNHPLPNNVSNASQPDSTAQLAPSNSSNGASSIDGTGASMESYAGVYMCETCACVFRFPRHLLAHYASENHHPSYF